MSETKITPRFKTKYAEVVVPALQEEFKYQNVCLLYTSDAAETPYV